MYQFPTKIDDKHLLACLSEEAAEVTEICMEYSLGSLDTQKLVDLYHEFVDLKTVYLALVEHQYMSERNYISSELEYQEDALPQEISKRCSELIKACSKSIRFGIHNGYKERLNEDEIHHFFHEIDSLLYLFLKSLGFRFDNFDEEALISRKRGRIYHFYELINLS